MTNLRIVFLVAHLTIACLATGVQAATFTVTQGGCAGSGSLRDAVLQANANPGKDTINFDASLTTVKPTFDGTPSCTPVDSIVITDSVDIIGTGTAGLNISDNVQWVTPSGNINAALACDSGNILIADGDVPFVIDGDGNPVVAIKNLTFRGNFGVIQTRSKPAVLNLENVIIRDSYAGERTQCTGPLIDISGELNMTDVVLFFNKMSNVAPRDAIVSAKGNARLERVRFSSNRAASQFSWLANESSDIVTIRESSFSSPQPRISIAGGTANIINTLVVGQSGGAGVWGLGATINLINSTINLPEQFTTGRGVGGAPAGATHVWMEQEGRVELFNTIIHAGLPIASGALPLVGTSGTAYIVAEADSHITDGSGPSGPSTGDPKLAGNIPTGAPTLDGGDDGKAFDPESLGPLATDLEGNPRIQGPAVEKGAYEVLSNFSREDRYTVQQNTLFDSGSLSVLDNDTTYTPGATLAAILQTPTGLGTLNFNTDGTFTYQPQTGDYGTRIFTYYMTVNGVPANEAQVVLDVQKAFPINTKPDNYSINEGQTLVTTANNAPLVNDDLQEFIYTSGPKGSIVKVIDPPDHAAPGGFVFPPSGIFSYTPATGFSGTDTFTYEIFFEKLGISGSAETQVTIHVLDINKPPVAQDDAYSTQQGVGLSISSPGLLANDSDPDGNTLSTVKKSDPAHGTVTFSPGGAFTYFPDAAFVGVDSFTYAASDGKAESNIAATVTITVNAINTPPIAQADKYRIPADSLLSVPARGGVLRNDTDPDGDSLTVFLGQDASNGSVQLQPDGSFSYQPDVGFSGLDSFEYELTDGKDTVPGIVNLIVTPTNQPPISNSDAYSVVQDTKLIVPAPSFLANDSDPEGHELSITIVQDPVHGQYTFDPSGAFIYTPNPGFTGSDLMGYVANDGELDSQAAFVLIQVTPAPVNKPPVAHNDAWTMPQDSVLNVAAPGVLANDVDPEGHALTATLLATPATGTFAAVPGGGFSYRPPAGFSGQVSFTYKVNDGHSDSATATGIITVSAVNNAPVANNDAYAMNAGLTLQVNTPGLTTNDSDPDGDALTVILSGAPAHGLLSNNGKGGFQYSPEFGFTGIDSFTYHVSDGKLNSNEATVQITVSGFNRAPVAIDDAWSIPINTTLNVNAPGVLVNDGDPEGHALTVIVTGQPTHGHLSPHPDGSFTYAPDPGFFGIDTFTYKVNDGLIDSNDATVQITVNEVNLPPVAIDDAYATRQDTLLNVAAPGILGNDYDPEGHQLIAWLLIQPANGHLVPVGGGGFTYDPDPGFFGEDSFSYLVSDGEKDSSPATVRITVNEAKDSTFTANVVWNVIREGGNPVETHNPVTITCDRDITSASSGNISNDMRTATAVLGDGGFLTITVDTSGGAAACSAAQTITESGVETESDCQVRLLEAGSSDSCTFVNTVFFEGIPMLGDRGLAILVLLMLGMGVVGVRRFA